MPTQKLFTIDSRDRENTSDGQENIRLTIEGGITFRRISLIFADLPNDVDNESIYFMTIRELGNGVRGTRYNDNASFVQIKTAPTDSRSFAFLKIYLKLKQSTLDKIKLSLSSTSK